MLVVKLTSHQNSEAKVDFKTTELFFYSFLFDLTFFLQQK
jgi:hypothetical protein